MGSVVYCETKETVSPYMFSNTRVMAYSYEEACYYIVNNPSLLSELDFSFDFASWVKDKLGLEELGEKIIKQLDAKENYERILDSFLSAYNYLSREEISMFFERLKGVGLLKEHLRLKKQADGYLKFEKYVRAIRLYRSILKMPNLEESFVATVYHNLGIALAKNLEYNDALKAFYEAYKLNSSEITLSCYLSIIFVTNQDLKDVNEDYRLECDKEVYDSMLLRFKQGADGYINSDDGKLLSEVLEAKKYGRDKDAKIKVNKLIEKWKEDYRRQTT
ncbi:MAG: tetratricopeptide repeat protein [Lachnospiraceae bacterium]|nr:tetratricopeptide repeat protein [Lachnospiraceae bacterium]